MYRCILSLKFHHRNVFPDCQDASRAHRHFRRLLAAVPRVFPVFLPFSRNPKSSLHSTCILGILLVRHGSLNGQSHCLLLYEPKVGHNTNHSV